MPASPSRLAYPDCEEFLNGALADDLGLRKPFGKRGGAQQFLVRLNNFRTICRKDNAKIFPEPDHPLHGRCEYDPLMINIVGPDEAGEWWVYARRLDNMDSYVEKLSEVEGNGDAPV